MCEVRGDERLAVSGRRFRWDRAGGRMGIAHEANLTFIRLSRADEGNYTCTSTITSPYLTSSLTVNITVGVEIGRKFTIDHKFGQ